MPARSVPAPGVERLPAPQPAGFVPAPGGNQGPRPAPVVDPVAALLAEDVEEAVAAAQGRVAARRRVPVSTAPALSLVARSGRRPDDLVEDERVAAMTSEQPDRPEPPAPRDAPAPTTTTLAPRDAPAPTTTTLAPRDAAPRTPPSMIYAARAPAWQPRAPGPRDASSPRGVDALLERPAAGRGPAPPVAGLPILQAPPPDLAGGGDLAGLLDPLGAGGRLVRGVRDALTPDRPGEIEVPPADIGIEYDEAAGGWRTRRIEQAARDLGRSPPAAGPMRQESREPQEASMSSTYEVKAGDTLGAIARRNKVSVAAIVRANDSITDPDRIFPGQSIVIPSKPGDDVGILRTPGAGAAWTGSDAQKVQLIGTVLRGSEGWIDSSMDGTREINGEPIADGVYKDSGGQWSTGFGESFKSRPAAVRHAHWLQDQIDKGMSPEQATFASPNFARHWDPVSIGIDRGLFNTMVPIGGLFGVAWQGPALALKLVDDLLQGKDPVAVGNNMIVMSGNARDTSEAHLELYERRRGEMAEIFGLPESAFLTRAEAERRRVAGDYEPYTRRKFL